MYEQNSEENILLRKCAQEIAAAVASAINFDVIITDTEGVVVGSSNADRLEQFHEASLSVVASGEALAPARGRRISSEARCPA